MRDTKKILLELSMDDYNNLRWLADKCGFSITKMMTVLIPNLRQNPPAVITDPGRIREASPTDLVAVIPDCNREEVESTLERIAASGAAITLVREIRQQLLEKAGEGLTVVTYKRLSRWCHPYRQTEREQTVKPLAEKLSMLLFGRIIKRID